MRVSQAQTSIHDSSSRNELNLVKDQLHTERTKRQQLELQLGRSRPSPHASPLRSRGHPESPPGHHHGSPVGVWAVEAQLRERLRVAGLEEQAMQKRVVELERALESFGDQSDLEMQRKEAEVAALREQLEEAARGNGEGDAANAQRARDAVDKDRKARMPPSDSNLSSLTPFPPLAAATAPARA